MMVDENGDIAYRDSTAVAKLMYVVMGDDVIEASLKGNREQELDNTNLTRDDALKMLAKIKNIKHIILNNENNIKISKYTQTLLALVYKTYFCDKEQRAEYDNILNN